MYSWDNAQVVLVGNKCDLEQDRAVTQERGKRLADQLGNCCKCCILDVLVVVVLRFLLLFFFLLYINVVLCIMFFKGFYR
jgi:GTPase SAR1 family protein